MLAARSLQDDCTAQFLVNMGKYKGPSPHVAVNILLGFNENSVLYPFFHSW
jgi:hypothetical protein